MSSPAELLDLPLGFTTWHPVTQAVTLGALTLLSEDTVAMGSALLTAVGTLQWPVAFWGTFLGIWLGDALLYWAARIWGRRVLNFSWTRNWTDGEALAASERWFARRGAWVLVATRFMPGTRLPTFLAAGFLRMPFLVFLGATGMAGLAWSSAVFGLAFTVGDAMSGFLARFHGAAWVFPLLIVLAWILIAITRRLCAQRGRWQLSGAINRWRHWEFWPPWLFYAPVAVYYVWLAARFRSWTLPTAANPGMTHGGMVGESKFETLRELAESSPEFTAAATRLKSAPVEERVAELERWMGEAGENFPLVLKPDLGQRGVGVRVVRSMDEARAYLGEVKADVVAQRHVAGPFEAGVFYVRYPGEARGRIFAMTEKIFPRLVGDGRHTIEDLIWQDPRARCMARRYLARLRDRWKETPSAGEEIRLVETGNHAQGCVFRDGAEWWSPELEERFDAISRRLNGFHFGRYDVRFASVEEFRAGRGFQILELNGASAEATGIYDRRNSLFAAYRTLFRQWRTVFEIGAAHRARGVAPTPLRAFLTTWRAAARHFATCPLAD
jgi:membrane protein DedA with SNARE-associated domain